MKIIIHQSLCGEHQKQWSLLRTTLHDTELAKSIAFNTGLHDQVGSVQWKPVIRGFMYQDIFLLMKTYPDTSPDVRPKRVFSHVLMIRKTDFLLLKDIGSLFKFFSPDIRKDIKIDPIEFETNTTEKLTISNAVHERFNKIITTYRNISSYNNTIVWVGEDDFSIAIIKFWGIITEHEKQDLNFGIYFNNDVVPKTSLNLITTPESIANKFINNGFLVLRKEDKVVLTDIVDQFIAGEEKALHRINSFKEAIGIITIPREKLDRIIIGINPFEEFDSLTDLKKLISLAHIVAEFSPDENLGLNFKEKLLHKIAKNYKGAEINDFGLIRTFPVSSFIDAQVILIQSTEIWIKGNLFLVEKTKDNEYLHVFKYLSQQAKNWWVLHVQKIISDFLHDINKDHVTIIYNWISKNFEIFTFIHLEIPISKSSEDYFCDYLSLGFDDLSIRTLKEFAAERKWYKFHATILFTYSNFETSIVEQLHVDQSPAYLDGLNLLLKGVKPIKVLDAAVKHGDSRLIKTAAHLCHLYPSLLNKIDFSDKNWLEIWEGALSDGNGIIDGFKYPKKKIFELFDSIISGTLISDGIWFEISKSEFVDLNSYPRREQFWIAIPDKYINAFLEKTSSSLLNSLSKNSNTEIPGDILLSDFIISHAIGTFLYFNPLKNSLPIFQKYPSLPEHYITTYIQNYANDITVFDGKQFGKLVLSRKYYHVANALYDKASKQNNWRFALAECHQILDFFKKGALVFNNILNNVNITSDQWWESAEEIIVDLYSNPNSIVTIWKKSGGRESDLLLNSNSRNTWSDAIGNLRNSRYSSITMCYLLKQINKNYSSNDRFKILYDLRKKFISCK